MNELLIRICFQEKHSLAHSSVWIFMHMHPKTEHASFPKTQNWAVQLSAFVDSQNLGREQLLAQKKSGW